MGSGSYGAGPQSQKQEVSGTVVAGAVSIVLIVFGSVVGLTLAGRPIDAILYLVPLIIAPTLLSFLTAKKLDRNKEILSNVQTALGTVAVNTNGANTKLNNDKQILEAQLIELGHTPITHADYVSTISKGRHSNG